MQMKAVTAALALSLLVSGCLVGQDQTKVKTQSNEQKKEKKQPKLSALEKQTSPRYDIPLFLNRAERVVEDLHFAAASLPNGKTVKKGGVIYRQLPKHLDTKDKIMSSFTRYWSRPLAEKLYSKLPTTQVNGKVYLASQYPSYPMVIGPKNTSIKGKGDQLVVVVRNATLPSYAQERTVTYRLVRDPKSMKYAIQKRTGLYKKEIFD